MVKKAKAKRWLRPGILRDGCKPLRVELQSVKDRIDENQRCIDDETACLDPRAFGDRRDLQAQERARLRRENRVLGRYRDALGKALEHCEAVSDDVTV